MRIILMAIVVGICISNMCNAYQQELNKIYDSEARFEVALEESHYVAPFN